METPSLQQGIHDARTLGPVKFGILGIQHLFAMFGATILVPAITGLNASATLLFAGVGTLLFHFISKWKVPAFLGSSFAFIGGYLSIKQLGMDKGLPAYLSLDYACIGVACAGLCYFIMAALIKGFGSERVLKYFPPVVTGPMIISIGLCLSGSAITNASEDWLIALVAIFVVIISNMWGKGIVRIIPILLGVVTSYGLAACMGQVDFSPLQEAAWIGWPVARENTVLAVFDHPNYNLIMSSIIAIMPIAFATIMEHIGDMCAISGTVGKLFLADPGLHRTLTGDGVATALSSLFGAPANTTYGENTGVLSITKVYDPRVIRLAAIFAILLSFCPKFTCLVSMMPAATIGGVSLILYGMISSVGIRNIVEANIDFMEMRNIIIAALILVIAIGVKYGANDSIAIGSIHLSGLALAAIIGILLNAILPHRLDIDIDIEEYK